MSHGDEVLKVKKKCRWLKLPLKIPQTDDQVQRIWLHLENPIQPYHLSLSPRVIAPSGWGQSQLLGQAPDEAVGLV